MAIINGTINAETLIGTTGDDYFDGLGGNDTVDGDAGNWPVAVQRVHTVTIPPP